MDNQQPKSKDQKSYYRQTTNRSFVIGSVIATLIAISPFLIDSYKSVPDTKVWSTFLFTYDSGWYQTVQISAWVLCNKLVPLYLLLIWFFTCRHWWYHTLLVPIALYVYQIIDVLNADTNFAEDNQILYMLPIMAIVIPSIYLIRARMFNKLNDADKTMQELEEEFKIKPKGFFGRLKDYF